MMTTTEVHQWCDENLAGFDCRHCGKCCICPGCTTEEKTLILDYLFEHNVKPVDNGPEICPFRYDGKCLVHEVRPGTCRAIGYNEKEGACKNTECDDCDGSGIIGIDDSGNKHACETCGGHEDSSGTGERPSPNINIKGKWPQLLRLYGALCDESELYLLHDVLPREVGG